MSCQQFSIQAVFTAHVFLQSLLVKTLISFDSLASGEGLNAHTEPIIKMHGHQAKIKDVQKLISWWPKSPTTVK